MNLNRFVCHLTLVCLSLIPLFAQETKDTESEVEVKENLVVWATAVKTSTAQLSEEAMTLKQADHLSDLLRSLPGVDVGGAHSLNQRLTIRGMDDKDLHITIDGATQNSYMYHHMGNLQIHADILKSVDLQVGTNSVTHGGLGGGARFETKDAADLLAPNQKFGARFLANHGDNNAEGFSGSAYGRMGSFDVLAYVNKVARDNYKVGGSGIKDGAGNLIPGTDGRVRGHEGDVSDALFKWGWNMAENHRLEMSFEAYDDEGDYSYRPDMGLATDLAIADNLNLPLVYPTEFTRDTLSLNYTGFLANNTNLKATLYANESSLWRNEQSVADVFGGPSSYEGVAENNGLSVLANTVVGEMHQLNYGVNLRNYETQYMADGISESAEESSQLAFIIEDRIQVTERLLVVPGLRYDQVDMDSSLSDETFDGTSAALALEFQGSDQLLLRASSTGVFKAPEIGEVFIGAGLYDNTNPNIEAEEGFNHEVGLVYQDAAWGAEDLRLGITAFRTELDNYIYDYVRTAEFRGKDNVGSMVLDGFEIFANYRRGGFEAILSYDKTDTDLSADEVYANLEGARLDREQGDSSSLALDYVFKDKGIKLHWETQHVADVDAGLNLDGASLDNSKDAYTVHHLSFLWAPPQFKGATLIVAADNVFDTYFASHSSRTGVSFHPRFGNLYLLDYEPGRNIKTTLSYRF